MRRLPRYLALLSVCLCIFLLPSREAAAWQGDPDHDAYAVDRRGVAGDLAPRAVRSVRLDAGPEWTDFVRRHPGWVAGWHPGNGRLLSATGPASGLGPNGAPSATRLDASTVEDYARRYLAAGLAPWFPADDQLDFVRAIPVGDRWWVHFGQRVNGVPVWNARVSLHVLADGRVDRVVNRAFRGVAADPNPAITREAARGIAATDLPLEAEEIERPELVLLPIERGSATEFRLTWKSAWRTSTPVGRWETFVDAVDGRLLWRFNSAHAADLGGHLSADLEPANQGDTLVETAMPYLTMVAVGGGLAAPATITTDAAGDFALVSPNAIGRQLNLFLAGPNAAVYSYPPPPQPQMPQPVPPYVVTVPDVTPFNLPLRLTAANFPQAGLDAFHVVNLAHDYVKAIDPSLTAIDFPAPIVLNAPGACNAYWDGVALRFIGAGSGCDDAARTATIVMHEYGHLVTDLQYRPFFPTLDMHEGFSDYLACSMTDQPILGANYYDNVANSPYIRRIDVDRRFPDDLSSDPHINGLIIASTLWDLREMLGAGMTDSLWHFARYGYADNFDDYFIDFLLTDDDNGNIYDGTPHFTPITGRYRAHGIGDYTIHVSHAPEPDTEDLAKTFPLTASFLSIFPLIPSSVRIHLEIENDGITVPSTIEMTPTGGVREYQYRLEAQPAGTEVRYWFSASDTAGGSVLWPPEGDDDPFRFRIGTDTDPPVIVHQPLDDQPVDDDSRLLAAVVTDNLDHGVHAVRLVHRRNGGDTLEVPMTGTPPEYRAGLPVDGLSVGDLFEYRIEAADSAMTTNIARFPGTGWRPFHVVRGYGRDFEANAGGAVGGGDWERGVPGFGLVPPSGQKVWGTVLLGAYHDGLASTLEFAPADLSGFTHGTLSFRHHIDCEPFYDGGMIEVSGDNGAHWEMLTPDGGYPFEHLDASGLPGFSGTFDGWRPVEANLSAYAGNPSLRIRVRFFSDVGVSGPGWYIDDVKVVDRLARLRPAGVMASTSNTGHVTVTWAMPAGYSEAPAGPVLGYHVERAASLGGERVRLTGVPLTVRQFEEDGLLEGSTWQYWVTAVYAGGESQPIGPATVTRVRPIYEGEWSMLEAVVDSGAVLDTVLVVRNTGTGNLRVTAWPALPGQTLDDVRRRLTLVPFETGWDTLLVDASESDTLAADLRMIEVHQTADSLLFRLTAWRPWGDPTSDFSLAVEIELDDDVSTGPNGDAYALIGARALALTGQPAALFVFMNDSYTQMGAPLTWSVENGGQVAVIGFDKTLGTAPPIVGVVARAYVGATIITADRAPNAVNYPWLLLGQRHLEIVDGGAANLPLHLGSTTLPSGLYTGRLLLETTDPMAQEVALPIALTVDNDVPVAFGTFTAVPVPEGLALQWTTTSATEHLGFRLVRRTVLPIPSDEVSVGPELIRPAEDGATYRVIDTGVQPGFVYEYRLADVARSGRLTWHGPFRMAMPGAAVPATLQLSPARPNPAPGATSLAWALPVAGPVDLTLFSVDGRAVRHLLKHAVHEAGWHEVAWDGRDDDGGTVPSGVYFYRLQGAGKVVSRKLLLVR